MTTAEYNRARYLRRKEYNKFYTIRIPKDDYEELLNEALNQNTSVNALILTYIQWGLENDAKS